MRSRPPSVRRFNTTQKAFIFVEDAPLTGADTHAAEVPSPDNDSSSDGHPTKHPPRVMFPDKLEGRTESLLHVYLFVYFCMAYCTRTALFNKLPFRNCLRGIKCY